LLALLVAFALNLDQPKWALLTVFIVAQPQSGLVLAKSFYRIIGTLVGATVALLLVSLFAQERVLFLGTLAVWIGLCTFASKHAKNFAAYGFVLSGYTVAIVGIAGALDPANAFFIAVARVTEISLGIMTTAVISHLVLPLSLADSLRHAVTTARTELANYAAALVGGRGTALQQDRMLGQVIAIENLRASAIFEDHDIAERSDTLRSLEMAMLGVIDIVQLLGRSLERLRRTGNVIGPSLDHPLATTETALELWCDGKVDAAGLCRRFAQARAELPLAREFYSDSVMPDEEIVWRAAVIGRLREFLTAFSAFANSYEAFPSGNPRSARTLRFAVSNDLTGAVWAGLRAAAALVFVSAFWILADWPSGATAAITATIVTARLATMEHALLAAIGGTFIIAGATIPSFILIEALLPDASGFEMFALAVAPMLFGCAYLMASEKTAGIGFLAGLYFAYAGGFQDRMAYDPVAFLNTSIALVFALATAAVLFAIVAPDTPEAARSRFVRIARKAFERIARQRISLTEFETAITEALHDLRRGLRGNRREDVTTLEAGVALLGTGRELIRVRDRRPTHAKIRVEEEVIDLVAGREGLAFERARRAAEDASIETLAELRKDRLGAADARAAAREMVAFAAIRDELKRSGELLLDPRQKRAIAHVA
jgi:uncharacterized membrane protein YccC